MAENYEELQRHLNRVRRAWRRAKALQGLSAVVIEGVGMFLVFALIDHAYAMPQTARILVLAGIGAVLAVLFALHVGRPLTKKISDDQIALYIEEHQHADGALLTATTFGREKSSGNAVSRFIVERVMNSAVSTAGSLKLAELLDLSKLRKYGIAVLLLIGVLGISAVRFSNLFGRSVNRLLLPWEVSEEDRRSQNSMTGEPAIQFELSTDTGDRVLRGTAVTVKAKLSLRPANGAPVELKYRAGGDQFRSIKLEEIDELNTFAVRLPDINDDLHFFAQVGADKSDERTVNVYDRVELKGLQITQTPPAYTHLEATTQDTDSGDITALTGTRVAIRAMANGPLFSGTLKFDDGRTIDLKADEKSGAVSGEFVLEKDATYTVSATTLDGQHVGPTSSFVLKTINDEPPSVAVDAPGSDLEVHAFAEVDFLVKANDDVGLDSVALVYTLSSDESHSVTVPFKLDGKQGPGEHIGTLTLALGDLGKSVQAGDSLMYYVSAKDLKGQETLTDLFSIQVRPFEVLVALPKKGGHAPDHESFASLLQFIATAWNIHTQKPHTPEAEYNQRCDALAGQIMKVDSAHIFGPGGGAETPESKKQVGDAFKSVLAGVDALKHHDALKAVTLLRQGMMMYKRATVSSSAIAGALGGKQYSSFAGGDPMRQSLGSVEIAPPPIHEDDPPFFSNPVKPDYLRQINIQDEKNAKELAVKLKKQQQDINKEARKLADQNQKGGGGGDEEQEQQQQNNANPEKAAALQKEQEKLAKDVAKMAQQLGEKNPNGDKEMKAATDELRKTADEMQNAAADMKAGNMQRAAAHGDQAVKDLNLAEQRLNAGQFDQLEQAVAAAEDRAMQVADNQKKIREATQRVLDEAKKRNPNNTPHAGEPGDANPAKPEGANPGKPELNAQDLQKLKGIARWQAENQKNEENLEEYVGELGQWAEKANKKETADALRKAGRAMKLEKVGDNMLNIAVDLGMNDLEGVAEAQAKLDKALNKVEAHLQDANGGLAQTSEQKMQRALGDAKRLLDKAQELADANTEHKGGEAPGHENKDGEKPGNDKAGNVKHGDDKAGGEQNKKPGEGGAQAKADEKKGEVKGGDANNKPGEANAQAKADAHGDPGKPGKGEQNGEPNKDADKQAANAPGQGKGKAAPGENAPKKPALTAEEKREAAAELFRGTVRLAKRLEQDKLALNAQPQLGDAARDEKSFAEMFKEGRKTKLDAYLATVKSVSTTLEGKLEMTLKARRLTAGQREETPTQYREMVNSYYQRLANQ